MGKADRAERRRGERMITLPASELHRIATEQAQKFFDEKKEALTKDIVESVNVSWCYLIAKSLEDSFKWFETSDKKDPKKVEVGISRIYKVLDNFLNSVEDMEKGLISIETIGEYFQDKGLILRWGDGANEGSNIVRLPDKERATNEENNTK